MDKINELMAWFLLTFSYWAVKSEKSTAGEKSEPEAAPAAGSVMPEVFRPTDREHLHNERLRENYIMSVGLADVLNRNKVRRNMFRRKEDHEVK